MAIEEVRKVDEEGFAAWNEHDVEKFVALCSDNLVWRDVTSPEPFIGKEGARGYMQGWMTAFPDLEARPTNRVLTEDWVAVELEFGGTNTGPLQMGPAEIPATGKRVTGAKGAYFGRVQGGQIVEFHTYPDVAGMMMQLGLMPPA